MCRTAIAGLSYITISRVGARKSSYVLDTPGCFIVAISPALIDPYPLCYQPRPRCAGWARNIFDTHNINTLAAGPRTLAHGEKHHDGAILQFPRWGGSDACS